MTLCQVGLNGPRALTLGVYRLFASGGPDLWLGAG